MLRFIIRRLLLLVPVLVGLSVLLFILGIQSIALGLIGEMIVHFNAARGRIYRIKGAPPLIQE